MSYLKAKIHEIQFRLGLHPTSYSTLPDRLAGFKGAYFYGKGKEKRGDEVGEWMRRLGIYIVENHTGTFFPPF